MKRFHTLTTIGMAALALVVAMPASDVFGQAARDIIGSWVLVSVTVNQGGQKIEPFGPNPKGALMFDHSRFSIAVSRSDLPRISSNNRQTGTPEENKAIIQGSIAYFGTYSVREEERTFVLHVEGGTFPNWVGTDQKRIFTITRDELRYTNSDRSSGAGTALVVWKRAK